GGKVRLTPARLDLAALARTAAGDHRAELEAAGLALAVEAPDRPVWVRGDEARLVQVLGNLLSNARKFTDPGGRVTVRVTEEGAQAVLAVADTGVGIAPEGLAGLFEAFHQVESGMARGKGGHGRGRAGGGAHRAGRAGAGAAGAAVRGGVRPGAAGDDRVRGGAGVAGGPGDGRGGAGVRQRLRPGRGPPAGTRGGVRRAAGQAGRR